MSGLVGYDSSDEDDDAQPERPAKVAKITHAPSAPDDTKDSGSALQCKPPTSAKQLQAPPANKGAENPVPKPGPKLQATVEDITSQETPLPGPSAPLTNPPSTVDTPASAPLSPYTYERQRLRELTMPTIPNFDIPDSPPPPLPNSEEAAVRAATTKKFERFLELKRNGTHFNQRLQNTSSLRNPSLLPKLMEFAGISTEESYASTLENGMNVPTKWPDECYVENLVKVNERREKKRVAEREKVEFVTASKSGASSKAGTPKSGGEGRKSKFDRK